MKKKIFLLTLLTLGLMTFLPKGAVQYLHGPYSKYCPKDTIAKCARYLSTAHFSVAICASWIE